MGGGGAISGMVQSMKMNSRRVPREHFKKNPGMKPEKTLYDVPTVSAAKREAIVQQILEKRKRIQRIGWFAALLITVAIGCYIVFG